MMLCTKIRYKIYPCLALFLEYGNVIYGKMAVPESN